MPQQLAGQSELDDFFKAPAKPTTATAQDLDSFFATPPQSKPTTPAKGVGGSGTLYESTLGRLNAGVDLIRKPATMAAEALSKTTDKAIIGVMPPQARAALWAVKKALPESVGAGVEGGVAEAGRQGAKVVTSFALDPINIPFLFAGGPAVRPAVRLAADALMVGMQEHGAIDSIKTTWNLYDPQKPISDQKPEFYEAMQSATMQQGFALLGAKGAAEQIKVLKEAATRKAPRTEQQVKSDAGVVKAAEKVVVQQRMNRAQRRATTEVPETTAEFDAARPIPEDPWGILKREAEDRAIMAELEAERTAGRRQQAEEGTLAPKVKEPAAVIPPAKSEIALEIERLKAENAAIRAEQDAAARRAIGKKQTPPKAPEAVEAAKPATVDEITAFLSGEKSSKPAAPEQTATAPTTDSVPLEEVTPDTTTPSADAPPIKQEGATTLLADKMELDGHEVRGTASKQKDLPNDDFRTALVEGAEAATPDARADYLTKLKANAERLKADVPQLEVAEQALADGDVGSFALQAEIARAELSSRMQRTNAREQFAEMATPEELAQFDKNISEEQAGKPPHFLEAEKKTKAFDSGKLVESELGPQDSTTSGITFSFDGEKGAVKIGAITRPLHNIRQAIFEATERWGEYGLQKAGDAIGKVYESIVPEGVKERVEGAFGQRPEGYKDVRREFRGQQAELRDAAESTGDALLKSLPTAESRQLAAKLAQNKATPQEVARALQDPEIQAAAEFVRNEFMRLGEAIVAEGVGQYGKLDPASRAALIEVMKGQAKIESLSPELQKLATNSIAKYFGEYLPRLYTSKEAMGVLQKYGLTVNKVRQSLDRLKKRNEALPPEVREALGEITEIIEPAVKGIYQEEMMLAKNRFFQKVAEDPSLTLAPEAERPALWKTLPASDLLGPLSGQTVHPSVYRDMMEIVKAPGEAKKIMQTVNRLIKKGKTAYNPATQVRNYASNWITRDAVGGMDISTQAFRDMQAFRSIVRKDSMYREARKVGLFDTDYSRLDLGKLRLDDLPSVPEKGAGGAFDATAKMFEAIGKVDGAVTWAYKMGDDVPKLGMYSWLRHVKHLSPEVAAKRVLDVLPDYSEVLPIVEKARHSLVGPTFVSYQSIMVPRFARSILKHPLRAGKYVVLGSLVSRLLVEQGLKTQQEVDDERREMPGYMKPKAGGAMSPFLPLPFKDSAKRSLYLDLTYTLPFGDVMEGSGLFGLPPVFDIGILPRTLLDVGQNYNNYGSYIRGEAVDIYSDTDDAKEKARKVGAYIGGALMPSLTPKVGYGARRLTSAAKKTPSYYGDAPQDLPLAIAQVLGGFKTVAIDMDAEAAARIRELNRKIAVLDGRIRSASRNQSLSESEAEKLIDKLVADKERVFTAYEER